MASVEDAIARADVVVFAVWPETRKELIVKDAGLLEAGRIEVPGGDLHQNSGLNGRLLDLDQARVAVAATGVPA